MGDCTKNEQLPQETYCCQASGGPNHQSWRVSGPEVTTVATSRSLVDIISEVRQCHAMYTPEGQHTYSTLDIDMLRDRQPMEVPEQWRDAVGPPGSKNQAGRGTEN